MKKWLVITAFLGLATASNILTKHFGLVPAGPAGLICGAGAWLMGPLLLARDLVQDVAGRKVIVVCMGIGAALSWLLATPELAVASTAAFALSETCDFAVYTPMRRRGWTRAALLSGFAGAITGSAVFLYLAGFPLQRTLPGQLLATTITTVVSVGAAALLRRTILRRRIRRELRQALADPLLDLSLLDLGPDSPQLRALLRASAKTRTTATRRAGTP